MIMVEYTREENQAAAKLTFGFHRNNDKISSQRGCAEMSEANGRILESENSKNQATMGQKRI